MPGRGRRGRVLCGCAVSAALTMLLVGGHGVDRSVAEAGANFQVKGPTVSLAFGGDVLLGAEMNSYVARNGAAAPLAGVPELRAADLAIVNLESVVAPGADVVDTGNAGDRYFLGRPEMLEVLEAAGIDLVSTANNHARDYGTAALEAEDRLLTGMGMAHPGTGQDPADACAPAYVAPGGLRIAVFSINTADPAYAAGEGEIGTCYLAPGDRNGWERTFRPAFAEARTKADVILAMPHFRASLKTVPDPADRAVAQLLVDLGADAVLGDGAHKLQGIEVHNGRPILDNAGSLVFNFPDPDEAAIFVLTLSPAGVEAIRTVPLITEVAWTHPAGPAEGSAILASIDARSRDLGTMVTGGGLELAPQPRDPPTVQPENVARLNPGPAPGPVEAPPAACTAAAVPQGTAISPRAVGPLTLVGARVDRDRIDGPALIWLETFWRIDAPTTSDLSIAPRAVPERGTPWRGIHEPCDWAWPTSRWQPGVLYRDRYPLRPPSDIQTLRGVPALLSMTGYGPLAISVEVEEQGRVLGTSGVLRTVVLDPAVATRLGFIGGAAMAGLLIAALVAWRRRRGRRPN